MRRLFLLFALLTAAALGATAAEEKITFNARILDNRWVSLGTYPFAAGKPGAVEVNAATADGNVHIDAVQVLPVK